MLKRTLSQELKNVAKEYPVLAILGPRQSGKSTLVKALFKNKPYISFENLDVRHFAQNDPNAFLQQYNSGAIFDEVQRVPELFSYLQTEVDRDNTVGRFILTGSHQFNLIDKINQSLAGRIGLLKLLPFSLQEISGSYTSQKSLDEIIFSGMYPRIHDKNIRPQRYLSDYIETYIERDVRQIKNIGDLSTFTKFVKACAMRVGQTINFSSLGNDLGINYNTVKSWISILQGSFIIFLVEPHYANFRKRLVKAPKLYFYDSGLLCHLIGLKNASEFSLHALKGGIFESFAMAEFQKYFYNIGQKPPVYFWRDKLGHEIDCIIDHGLSLTPIELKAGKTVASDYFKNITYWNDLSQSKNISYIIYGGERDQKRSDHKVLSWKHLTKLKKILE